MFATSVENKQRRGAVIEQLVSLTLQSAVVMLIVSLTVMVMQKFATAMGSKMYATGKRMGRKPDSNKFSVRDAFVNTGASSLGNTIRKVMPRASYDTSYYRRRKSMI